MSACHCTECRWAGDDPQRITLTLMPSGDQVSLVVCPQCRCVRSSLVDDPKYLDIPCIVCGKPVRWRRLKNGTMYRCAYHKCRETP